MLSSFRLLLCFVCASAICIGVPLTASAQTCAPWGPGARIGTLSDEEVSESSGLASSWQRDDLLWTHNDSTYDPVLYLVRKSDAEVVTRVHLVGADNIDWEDIAIAPCEPGYQTPCVYVGDIGDNLARYPRRTIYRFQEPALEDPLPEHLEIETFDRIDYVYPDGPRDAEALLVHPYTAQLYIVEKSSETTSQVYGLPREFDTSAPVEATPIATLTINAMLGLGRMITAGDFSPDGREFTLRTYLNLYVYCAEDGQDFESAFRAAPVISSQAPLTIQGEALTYDRSDGALWLTSERLPTPLIRVPPRQASEGDPPPGLDMSAHDALIPGLPPESVDTSTSTSDTSSCACATPSSSRRSTLVPALLAGLFWMSRRRHP